MAAKKAAEGVFLCYYSFLIDGACSVDPSHDF